MAEKILNHFYGERAVADSAGTHEALPYIFVDDPTIAVMCKWDIDMSAHRAKSISSVTESFDIVINMSPESSYRLQDRLPHLKTVTWVEWVITDPRGQPIEVYRSVRDALKENIDSFFEEPYAIA